MQRIIPHLWFDTQAKEAAALYTGAITPGAVLSEVTLHDTPSGSVDIVTFELDGHTFQSISAGPLFKFNPSVSFLVGCATAAEVDAIWAKLAQDGVALMPLDAYPFSPRYGWTMDKYGLSWQIMHMGDRPMLQKIVPTQMFVGAVCGRCEEAVRLYASVFPDSAVGELMTYTKDDAPDLPGTVRHVNFTLMGQSFAAMDSNRGHDFAFNEAISYIVNCDTQREIDEYTDKLSADPSAEQCGWIKDKFGFSWQIVPSMMDAMMADTNKDRLARVTAAMLQMKRLDIAALQRAYDGG
jgi:predicted 3-demethylubiquinone-9 3-methyltransferase (glyoxalase superfamily)